MKGYDVQGFQNFTLCLGYRGDAIRDFFINYRDRAGDVSVRPSTGEVTRHGAAEEWNVTLANTGAETGTGLRLGKIRSHLEGDDYFMLTYGDGVGNIDINKLIDFHLSSGKTGTITAVTDRSRYGVLDTSGGVVRSFAEKGKLEGGRINGGFMVFDRKFLEHPSLGRNVMLEKVLADLSAQGELAAYEHDGFWHSMDTSRDYKDLNAMWDSGKAPWNVWSGRPK